MNRLNKFFKVLGPGLLYAGAAVGVSHLVQSTKAGAMFNFELVIVLILANFLKYPFFEYGARYANATGNNLIQGYARVGKWALLIFTMLTLLTMFTIQATVTIVTVGLIAGVLNLSLSVTWLSLIVLLGAMLILVVGRFQLLDKVMKVIMMLLAVSTIMAVIAALGIDKVVVPEALTHFSWEDKASIIFLIAFVGWMPAPIDISVWSSLWGNAKTEELGYKPPLKQVLFEFRTGYIGTALLAFGFLAMGALVMYGTGEHLSPNGTMFSEQLIRMYTTSLGPWAYWMVSVAAITTMLSTTISVLDAYPRVLTTINHNLFRKPAPRLKEPWAYIFWLVIMVAGAVLTIAFAASSMGFMVTLATSLSFITAPILAWLNYRVVTDEHVPQADRPGKFLRILSWTGIVFFVIFTVVYLYWFFVVN